MSYWLDDVRAYLIARGVVGSASWPIYEGLMPDDQDQTVGIFSTGGRAPETMGNEFNRPGMQLRVRGGKLEYAATYAKWKACYDVLLNADSGTLPPLLPEFNYICPMQTEPLTFTDGNGRLNFTSNWDVLINAS